MKQTEVSLKYFILGVFFEMKGHGYVLQKKHLQKIGHFRRVNEGQLYTEISKLEKEGLIEREIQVPDKGPVRKVIRITEVGRQTFVKWLRSDQYEDEGVLFDFMRGYPFFSKLSFLSRLPDKELLDKLEKQIGIQRRKREAYAEILQGMKERGVDTLRVDILSFGLDEIAHRIHWLEELRDKCKTTLQQRDE